MHAFQSERKNAQRGLRFQLIIDFAELSDLTKRNFAAAACAVQWQADMAKLVGFVAAGVAYRFGELLAEDDELWKKFKQHEFWRYRMKRLNRKHCLQYAFSFMYEQSGRSAERARAHASALTKAFRDGVPAEDVLDYLGLFNWVRGFAEECPPYPDLGDSGDANGGDCVDNARDADGGDVNSDGPRQGARIRETCRSVFLTPQICEAETSAPDERAGRTKHVRSTNEPIGIELRLGLAHQKFFQELEINGHALVTVIRREDDASGHVRLEVSSASTGNGGADPAFA